MASSSFIKDSVFKVNLRYEQLQNKSKQLFFKCLDEGQSVEYFKGHLESIWEEVDEVYLEQQILEYKALLHEKNTNKKLDKKTATIVGLATLGAIMKTNNLFKKIKEKEYKMRLNSYGYEADKKEYLKKLVPKYTSNVKVYRSQTTNKVVREVSPSVYNSMVYNTCLTRNGWVQTLNDGEEMGVGYYYIPRHNFSCPHCLDYQEKPMSKEECLRLLGTADEGDSELLHPNCACTLTFMNNNVSMTPIDRQQAEEEYEIRQKVNGLTLEKERILSDIKIQKSLGNYDEVDRLNNQRNKINSSIRELKEQLPTEELQKQVVAIIR